LNVVVDPVTVPVLFGPSDVSAGPSRVTRTTMTAAATSDAMPAATASWRDRRLVGTVLERGDELPPHIVVRIGESRRSVNPCGVQPPWPDHGEGDITLLEGRLDGVIEAGAWADGHHVLKDPVVTESGGERITKAASPGRRVLPPIADESPHRPLDCHVTARIQRVPND
jgi:hypothetical protein